MRTSITKAGLIELKSQHDQFYRPMEAHLTPNTVDEVIKHTADGTRITSEALSPVAARILTPSTTPIDRVKIEHGFQQRRFSFYIEITTFDTGALGNEVVTLKGYTEYDGVGRLGTTIAPDMVFYVDTYTRRHEKGSAVSIRNSDGVINPIHSHLDATLLSPSEAILFSSLNKLRRDSAYTIITPQSSLSRDARNYRMSDLMPTKYLADTLNGYVRAASPWGGGLDMDDDNDEVFDIFGLAASSVMVGSFANNNWWNMLVDGSLGSCAFTYADLQRVFPDFPVSSWSIIPLNEASFSPGGLYGCNPLTDTDGWNSADKETHIAYTLIHLLPFVMTTHGLVQLAATFTNSGVYGDRGRAAPTYLVEYIPNLVNMNRLILQLEDYICKGFLDQQVIFYQVEIDFNMLSEAYMKISINGGVPVPFSAPLWCENTYTPMIGLDSGSLAEISAASFELAEAVLDSGRTYRGHPGVKAVEPIISLPSTRSNPFSNNNQFQETTLGDLL